MKSSKKKTNSSDRSIAIQKPTFKTYQIHLLSIQAVALEKYVPEKN